MNWCLGETQLPNDPKPLLPSNMSKAQPGTQPAPQLAVPADVLSVSVLGALPTFHRFLESTIPTDASSVPKHVYYSAIPANTSSVRKHVPELADPAEVSPVPKL